MENFDLIVIGGGAAGIFGALSAAESSSGLRIGVFEKTSHLLAKVLVSGGGRCNVTHACFEPRQLASFYPRGAKELIGPFSRFQPKDTMTWFSERGVALKIENDGRVFPKNDRSQTIVDCLLSEAIQFEIDIRTCSGINSVVPIKDGFYLGDLNGREYQAEKILFATGGGSKKAYSILSGLGHTIVDPVPSLFSFNVIDERIAGLAGISVAKVELDLIEFGRKKEVEKSTGAILITHWGFSGPAVLRISAWGARKLAADGYKAILKINWLPSYNAESLQDELKMICGQKPKQHPSAHSPFEQLSLRLWKRFVQAAGIEDSQCWNKISKKLLRNLAEQLTQSEFQIQGKGVFKDEFVTCGGVRRSEVDFRTMQSRIQPGLYCAGEVLDIDGLTGGFNFQSAWTTGWIAGNSIAESVLEDEMKHD